MYFPWTRKKMTMTQLRRRLAIRLAGALLASTFTWAVAGVPAAAEEISTDAIVRALTATPKTRSLRAPEQPAQTEAERGFVEGLRHRTRSLTLTERERAASIAEKQPSIDLEIYFDFEADPLAGENRRVQIVNLTAASEGSH
jgi:hypothetical protein